MKTDVANNVIIFINKKGYMGIVIETKFSHVGELGQEKQFEANL